MKLDYLETFLTAAEILNFTHAGRRLHLSQSAVSQQIRELEEDLGVSLFERRGRSMLLTPAGELLRAKAKPILRDVRRAREAIGELGDRPQGVLQLGAGNTPGIYLLPYAIGEFARRFPGIRISLRIADGPSLVQGLQNGELDAALVEDGVPAGRLPGWRQTALFEDELVLIVAAGHPWAGRRDLGAEVLLEGPLIFRQAGSPTRQLILDHVARAGIDPDRLATQFELGNTEAIKRAVMAGLGVGWVSRYACALERQAGWIAEVPIAGMCITRPLTLVTRTDEQVPRHEDRLLEVLTSDGWLPGPMGTVRSVAPAGASR